MDLGPVWLYPGRWSSLQRAKEHSSSTLFLQSSGLCEHILQIQSTRLLKRVGWNTFWISWYLSSSWSSIAEYLVCPILSANLLNWNNRSEYLEESVLLEQLNRLFVWQFEYNENGNNSSNYRGQTHHNSPGYLKSAVKNSVLSVGRRL